MATNVGARIQYRIVGAIDRGRFELQGVWRRRPALVTAVIVLSVLLLAMAFLAPRQLFWLALFLGALIWMIVWVGFRTPTTARSWMGVLSLIVFGVVAAVGTLVSQPLTQRAIGGSGGRAQVSVPGPTALPGQYRATSVIVDVLPFKQNVELLPGPKKCVCTIAVDSTIGKATYPIMVIVVDAKGAKASGVAVSFDGKSVQTDGNGVATIRHEFSTDAPISSESKPKLSISGAAPIEVPLWVAKTQLNNVGPPALNSGEMVRVSNTNLSYREVLSKVLGIPADQLVIQDLDVGVADGKTPMLQLVNGVSQQGSTPPLGQPVWVVTYEDQQGNLHKVFINPVCVNAFPSAPAQPMVPGNAPVAPAAPTSGPTLVVTPTPTSPPASPPTATPKVPQNGNTNNYGGGQPSGATPAPQSTPPQAHGSGTVTVTQYGCQPGSCTVSWIDQGTTLGTILCNGKQVGRQSGPGSYTVTFNLSPLPYGKSYSCAAYAAVGSGPADSSPTFLLTP